jgi:hypothetical protein
MSKRANEVHAMCDIETFSLAGNAPVLEVSFSIFDLQNEPIYEEMISEAATFTFNVDDQFSRYRLPNANTLLWWMTETSEAARKSVLNRSLKCKEDNAKTLNGIRSLLSGVEHVWCRGPHFDAANLISLCRDYEVGDLWAFYKTRDVRTLLYSLNKSNEAKKFKEDMEKSGEFVKHDSAHDVAIDAYLIATYMREQLITEQNNAAKSRRKQTSGRS